jgi:hypothetical protein
MLRDIIKDLRRHLASRVHAGKISLIINMNAVPRNRTFMFIFQDALV